MGIEKQYAETIPECKVTFILDSSVAEGAGNACLVGDFNGWNTLATPMNRRGDGGFSVTLYLAKGQEYQYRYFLDSERWETDWNASMFAPDSRGDAFNAVILV